VIFNNAFWKNGIYRVLFSMILKKDGSENIGKTAGFEATENGLESAWLQCLNARLVRWPLR
jgi:hypothetical protein